MPLQSTNMYAGGPIKAADVIQYFNLFTGSMTDQPVTFANTLTVGGSQSNASVPLRVSSHATGTARVMEVRTLQADVNPVFGVDRVGTLSWGPGGGTVTDVTLSRSGANQLTLTGLAGTPALIIPVGGLQVTAGNVGIGASSTPNAAIYTTMLLTSNTVEAGVWSAPVGDSSATVEIAAFYAQPQTFASSFTSTTVAGFHAKNPIKGATSTITNVYGLLVDGLAAGNTNNYGIYVNAPAGGSGSNIGINNEGTTRLVGTVGIGTAPQTVYGLLLASALAGGTQQFGVRVSPTSGSDATGLIAGIISTPNTPAIAFTVAQAVGFYAQTPGKGAGSSITSAYGIYLDPINTGNTNNYGIYINAPSGASGNNVGLYNLGTTYLNAGLGIGAPAGASNIIIASSFMGGFTAGARYVIYDVASGTLRISALGPAS